MRAQLARAMARVLDDIGATSAPVPEIEESDWQGHPGAESALLRAPDGSGTGVWVDTALAAEEQVAMLADQVQYWVIEELAAGGRPTNWPQCREHPDTHPMMVDAVGGVAAWRCPRTGTVVAEVGRLGSG